MPSVQTNLYACCALGSTGGAVAGSSRCSPAPERGARGDQRRRTMRVNKGGGKGNNGRRLVCSKLLRSLFKRTIMAYSWLSMHTLYTPVLRFASLSSGKQARIDVREGGRSLREEGNSREGLDG